jgi:tetratricopeptide (TPR) repeat protein
VVFAKLRERPRPAAAQPPSTALATSPTGSSASRPLLLLALLAATAAVSWELERRIESRRPPPLPAGTVSEQPLPTLPPPVAIPAKREPLADFRATSLPDVDLAAAQDLARRLSVHAPLASVDVALAEGLRARHPLEAEIKNLLVSTLVVSAEQDRGARRFETAAGALRRAIAVDSSAVTVRIQLMSVLLDGSDWAGAEAAVRDALPLAPQNGDLLEGLAYSLFRQDRNREAADVLHHAIDIRPNDSARSLLARIEKGLADERGMTEQRLSHFNVRYDGEAHEDVGREILRVLEHHYATLVVAFDHQPKATVAVILFTTQGYYDASGAPAWSGGEFDNFDGRIRIPVGGLTSSLSPEMDGTLIHELTHAFIHDLSRGLAPREVHEGLAQFMEGKRTATMLSPARLTALADGRMGGVGGFYIAALSYVEHLGSLRGQGGLNDLLRAMGRTGSVDDAFRQVYGQDYLGTRRAWADRLRLQNGS